MIEESKKKFNVSTDGIRTLYYEDSSCYVEVLVADFRDSALWVLVGKITGKPDKEIDKLSKDQKYEMYRRISADIRLHGYDGLYTDEFKFIEEDMGNIDYTKDILEI